MLRTTDLRRRVVSRFEPSPPTTMITTENVSRRVSPQDNWQHVPGEMLSDIMPDDAYAGGRCFVVGGGPSLRGFDFSRLSGELTIGVNKSCFYVDPCLTFTMDPRFIAYMLEGKLGEDCWAKFKALKATKVFWRKDSNYGGLGFKFVTNNRQKVSWYLSHGLGEMSNSGFGGLMLAVALGCTEIYLLGIDMKGENGRTAWFHDGYPSDASEERYTQAMLPSFTTVSGDLAQHGIDVVNLNPASVLRCFPFGEFDQLAPLPERPLVIGYYTEGNGYKEEAEKMVASAHRFGLSCDITAVDNPGSWLRATSMKTEILLSAAKKYPGRMLLYLDADAVITRYPALLNGFSQSDFAFPYVNWARYGRSGCELLTGTLLFRSTPGVVRLLEEWIDCNRRNPGVWEQKNLCTVLGHSVDSGDWNGVKVSVLPDEYCAIFDSMGTLPSPVIVQNQASRRLKQ